MFKHLNEHNPCEFQGLGISPQHNYSNMGNIKQLGNEVKFKTVNLWQEILDL